MAKYFLGSVGKAEAFRRDGNTMKLAFVSKTLTDSGLNISTTKDDIRAGQGAPIQFSFYHDPSVEITLTDVLWNKEYITAQLGATFSEVGDNGNVDYVTDTVTFANGKGTPTYEILPAPIPCSNTNGYLVWGAKQGSDEWQTIEYNAANNELTLSRDDGDGVYCVRYMSYSDKAVMAEISSLIIPQELYLLITAPIFAGDACSSSNGKAAGYITFEVPRFQLNGAQEFTMNMSQNQTMSLAGIALATESANCTDIGGKLLRIIEVITDRKWQDEVVGLIVDQESVGADEKPSVYAELKDGHLRKLGFADLKFARAKTASALNGATYAALGENQTFEDKYYYSFELNGNSAVKSDVVVVGTPRYISFGITNGSYVASDDAAFNTGVVTLKILPFPGYAAPATMDDSNISGGTGDSSHVENYENGVATITINGTGTDDLNITAACAGE